MDQAELYFQRALARKTRLGDLHGLAYTLGNLGRYFDSQERDDLAAHYLQRALELCEKLGQLKGRMVSLQGLARIAWRAGQWDQALDYLMRGEALVRQVGSRVAEAYLSLTRADYHLARGEWDRPSPCIRRAVIFSVRNPGIRSKPNWSFMPPTGAAKATRSRPKKNFSRPERSSGSLKGPPSWPGLSSTWGSGWPVENRLDEAAPHIVQALSQARSFEADKIGPLCLCLPVDRDRTLASGPMPSQGDVGGPGRREGPIL